MSYKCRGLDRQSFDVMYGEMATDLLLSRLVKVGEWQAKKGDDEVFSETLEVLHARVEVPIHDAVEPWLHMTGASLPWAEDHFKERVGGQPLNPPPSNEWWPYAVKGNEDFKADEKFSHTYPERFWPSDANRPEGPYSYEGLGSYNKGVRFPLGDYNDLILVLQANPFTRQAYLPVWFPEDLWAARYGERVPCTLGYHFLVRRGFIDVEYHIRSCDVVRHFRDDVYMAGRLAHDLIQKVPLKGVQPGNLIMNIGSLHAFQPDVPFLRQAEKSGAQAHIAKLMEKL